MNSPPIITVSQKGPSSRMASSPMTVKTEPVDKPTATISSVATTKAPAYIIPSSLLSSLSSTSTTASRTVSSVSTPQFNIPAPVMIFPQNSLTGLSGGRAININFPPTALGSSGQRSLLSMSSLQQSGNVGVRTVTSGGRTITIASPSTNSARLPVENVSYVSNSPALTINLSQGNSNNGKKTPANATQNKPDRQVCGLVYNTKVTTNQGGRIFVGKKKEYLCNFCQFKTAQYNSFNTHLTYHIFNCHHCTYKAFTRYELITHRQSEHPEFNYELSGFEGLGNLRNLNIRNNTNSTTAATTTSTASATTTAGSTTATTATADGVTAATTSSSSVTTTSASTIPTEITPITIEPSSPEESPVDEAPMDTSENTSSTTTASTTASTTTTTTTASTDTTDATTTASSPPVTPIDISPQLPVSPVTIAPMSPSANDTGKPKYRVEMVRTASGVEKHTLICNSTSCFFTCSTLHDMNLHIEISHKDKSPSLLTPVTSIQHMPNMSSMTDAQVAAHPTTLLTVVQWACFYCRFVASLQADVVKHLHKEHAGQELKVKRIVRQASSSRKPGDAIDANAPAGETILGCYYCEYTNLDRTTVIRHVRNSHPLKKIMICRKRSVNTDATAAASTTSTTSTSAAATTPTTDATSTVTSSTSEPAASADTVSTPSAPAAPASGKSSKRKRSKKRAAAAESAEESDVDYQPTSKKALNNSSSYELRYRPLRESELVNKEDTEEQTSISFNEEDKLVTVDFNKNPAKEPKDWDPNSFVETKEGGMKCKLCERDFNGVRALPNIKAHITLKHPKPGSVPWMCKYCPFGCQTKDLIMKHLSWKHMGQPLRLVCNEPFRLNNAGEIELVQIRVLADDTTGIITPARTTQRKRRKLSPRAKNRYLTDEEEEEEVVSPIIIQKSRHKNRLRGPRSQREQKIVKSARYVYQCEDCQRTSVMKSDIVKHITLVHPGKTEFSSAIAKLPRNGVYNPETKLCQVRVVKIEDMDKYSELREFMETDGDSLNAYLDVNDSDTEDEEPGYVASRRPMPKSRRKRHKQLITKEMAVADVTSKLKSLSAKEIKNAVDAIEEVSEEVREQLMYEQKIASEKAKELRATKKNQNPCFQCTHCEFTGIRDLVMKEHILDTHSNQEVAIINLKLIKKPKAKHHVYFCHVRMCDFVSKVRQAVLAHYSKVPSHKPEYLKGDEEGEQQEDGGILAGRGASLRHCARRSRQQPEEIAPELDFLYDIQMEEAKKTRKRGKKRKVAEMEMHVDMDGIDTPMAGIDAPPKLTPAVIKEKEYVPMDTGEKEPSTHDETYGTDTEVDEEKSGQQQEGSTEPQYEGCTEQEEEEEGQETITEKQGGRTEQKQEGNAAQPLGSETAPILPEQQPIVNGELTQEEAVAPQKKKKSKKKSKKKEKLLEEDQSPARKKRKTRESEECYVICQAGPAGDAITKPAEQSVDSPMTEEKEPEKTDSESLLSLDTQSSGSLEIGSRKKEKKKKKKKIKKLKIVPLPPPPAPAPESTDTVENDSNTTEQTIPVEPVNVEETSEGTQSKSRRKSKGERDSNTTEQTIPVESVNLEETSEGTQPKSKRKSKGGTDSNTMEKTLPVEPVTVEETERTKSKSRRKSKGERDSNTTENPLPVESVNMEETSEGTKSTSRRKSKGERDSNTTENPLPVESVNVEETSEGTKSTSRRKSKGERDSNTMEKTVEPVNVEETSEGTQSKSRRQSKGERNLNTTEKTLASESLDVEETSEVAKSKSRRKSNGESDKNTTEKSLPSEPVEPVNVEVAKSKSRRKSKGEKHSKTTENPLPSESVNVEERSETTKSKSKTKSKDTTDTSLMDSSTDTEMPQLLPDAAVPVIHTSEAPPELTAVHESNTITSEGKENNKDKNETLEKNQGKQKKETVNEKVKEKEKTTKKRTEKTAEKESAKTDEHKEAEEQGKDNLNGKPDPKQQANTSTSPQNTPCPSLVPEKSIGTDPDTRKAALISAGTSEPLPNKSVSDTKAAESAEQMEEDKPELEVQEKIPPKPLEDSIEPEMPSLFREDDSADEDTIDTIRSSISSSRSSSRKSPGKDVTPKASEETKKRKRIDHSQNRSQKKKPEEKLPSPTKSTPRGSVKTDAPPFKISRHLAADEKAVRYKGYLKTGGEEGLEELKGLMICRYCSLPSTTSLEEMKQHLLERHREVESVAIDVKMKFQKKSGLLYICMFDDCLFNTQKNVALIEHLGTHDDPDAGAVGGTPKQVTTKATVDVPSPAPSPSIQPPTSTPNQKQAKKKKKTPKAAEPVLESSQSDNSNSADLNIASLPDNVYSLAQSGRGRPSSVSKVQLKNYFSCRACKETFSDLTKCKAHNLLSHSNLEVFLVIDLRMQRVHKRCKIFMCTKPLCSYVCQTKEDMGEHVCDENSDASKSKKAKEVMFQCNFCVFTTSSKEGVKSHMKDKHGDCEEDGYTTIGAEYGNNGEFIMSTSANAHGDGEVESDMESKDTSLEDLDTTKEENTPTKTKKTPPAKKAKKTKVTPAKKEKKTKVTPAKKEKELKETPVTKEKKPKVSSAKKEKKTKEWSAENVEETEKTTEKETENTAEEEQVLKTTVGDEEESEAQRKTREASIGSERNTKSSPVKVTEVTKQATEEEKTEEEKAEKPHKSDVKKVKEQLDDKQAERASDNLKTAADKKNCTSKKSLEEVKEKPMQNEKSIEEKANINGDKVDTAASTEQEKDTTVETPKISQLDSADSKSTAKKPDGNKESKTTEQALCPSILPKGTDTAEEKKEEGSALFSIA